MSVGYTRMNATIFDGYGEDVKVGDKITNIGIRLSANGRPIAHGTEPSDVEYGIVTSLNITNGHNQRGFGFCSDRRDWLGWLADEGVYWIRGWHDRESMLVAALLATCKLARSAA